MHPNLPMPRYMNSNGDTVLDWTKPSSLAAGFYDEHSLMLVLGLSMFTQVLILIYIMMLYCNPSAIRRKYQNELRRRRFANFIYRRLLAQIERALRPIPRPLDLNTADQYVQAQLDAIEAMKLFRRDAARVLNPEFELHTREASELYNVLEEEEQELRDTSYANVNVEVTDEFLMQILHPQNVRNELSEPN